MSEEVTKGDGLEGVVNFAVGGTLAKFLLEPIGEGILEGKIVEGWSFGGEAKRFWEVMGENDGATGNGEGVLESVAQLADIAWPGVILEEGEGCRRKLSGAMGGDLGEEGGGESGEIFNAFGQGGNSDF